MDGESSLGQISISTAAIAQIVGHTAVECYGVVGLVARGGRIGKLLLGTGPERGVDVSHSDAGVAITLHVVAQHGLNLAEIAATLRTRVAYEVARLTGLAVTSVEVHVDDVRTSP